MALYYFHVRDGEYVPDEDGTDLPSLDAAKHEAVAFSGRLLAENAVKFWGGDEWFIEVTDARGLLLFKLMFAATLAPGPPDEASLSR